jgi:hypothetical protein
MGTLLLPAISICHDHDLNLRGSTTITTSERVCPKIIPPGQKQASAASQVAIDVCVVIDADLMGFFEVVRDGR